MNNETELINWVEQFILQANTAQITDDGGNSFNESFVYLMEKLLVKFEKINGTKNTTTK